MKIHGTIIYVKHSRLIPQNRFNLFRADTAIYDILAEQ